jgi:hypothetical protein
MIQKVLRVIQRMKVQDGRISPYPLVQQVRFWIQKSNFINIVLKVIFLLTWSQVSTDFVYFSQFSLFKSLNYRNYDNERFSQRTHSWIDLGSLSEGPLHVNILYSLR